MPRKGPALRREVPVDPIYKSVLVTQLTNKILERGKRTIAERIVYTALEQVEQKTGTDPGRDLEARPGERPSRVRSEEPTRGWYHVPGADGGSTPSRHYTGYPLVDGFREEAPRKDHGRAARQ